MGSFCLSQKALREIEGWRRRALLGLWAFALPICLFSPPWHLSLTFILNVLDMCRFCVALSLALSQERRRSRLDQGLVLFLLTLRASHPDHGRGQQLGWARVCVSNRSSGSHLEDHREGGSDTVPAPHRVSPGGLGSCHWHLESLNTYAVICDLHASCMAEVDGNIS